MPPRGSADAERRGRVLVGLLAMTVAVAGIGVSLAGRQFGSPLLENRLGPGVTLLAATFWIGFRAWQRRRR